MPQQSTGHVSRITHFALIVEDQEEALDFYTETLGFEKKEDSEMGEDRWLTVAPAGRDGVHVILRSPAWFGGKDADRFSHLVGHNPMIGLAVDDCHATYDDLRERGVEFVSEPQEREYGVEVIALDPEGNELLFVEPGGDGVTPLIRKCSNRSTARRRAKSRRRPRSASTSRRC